MAFNLVKMKARHALRHPCKSLVECRAVAPTFSSIAPPLPPPRSPPAGTGGRWQGWGRVWWPDVFRVSLGLSRIALVLSFGSLLTAPLSHRHPCRLCERALVWLAIFTVNHSVLGGYFWIRFKGGLISRTLSSNLNTIFFFRFWQWLYAIDLS